MEVKIDVPDYAPERGFHFNWQDNSEIKVEITDDLEVFISANKDGLVSLATFLLTLAQDAIPSNECFELYDYDGLEEGSSGLIVQKLPDDDLVQDQ